MEDNLKKILHSYNLLDDYFIDQDSTTTTGEINASPIDDAVFIGRYKDIYGQKKLMETAIDKIYKGYNAAYDKGAYKAQFDIYPMRDFDEHMASLGAKRTDDGIDFIGVGTPIDWIKKTKDEIALRLKERQKIEDEKKIDEEIAKKNAATDVVENTNVAADLTKLKEYLKTTDAFKDKLKDNTSDGELTELVAKLYKGESSKDIPLTSVQRMEVQKWITTNLKKITASPEETKMEAEKIRNKNKEAGEYNKNSRETIDEYLKKIQENKDAVAKDETDSKEDRRLLDENQKLENLIKAAESGRSNIIKGIKITEKQLKDINNTIGSDFERQMTKYDGFTTIGPFCKEKRDYFINVFRPSISHFDTEFRGSIPTKVKVKDEGNEIENFIAKKGGIPEEPKLDPSLDPTTGAIINSKGFDNKTKKGLDVLNKYGMADMTKGNRQINELGDDLNEFLYYVENLIDGLFVQDLETRLNNSQENYMKILSLKILIAELPPNRVEAYNKNRVKDSLKLNDSPTANKLRELYAQLLRLYDQNLKDFNDYFHGTVPVFYKDMYYRLKQITGGPLF